MAASVGAHGPDGMHSDHRLSTVQGAGASKRDHQNERSGAPTGLSGFWWCWRSCSCTRPRTCSPLGVVYDFATSSAAGSPPTALPLSPSTTRAWPISAGGHGRGMLHAQMVDLAAAKAKTIVPPLSSSNLKRDRAGLHQEDERSSASAGAATGAGKASAASWIAWRQVGLTRMYKLAASMTAAGNVLFHRSSCWRTCRAMADKPPVRGPEKRPGRNEGFQSPRDRRPGADRPDRQTPRLWHRPPQPAQ